MIGRGRMRTIDRNDVHAGEHLIERFPVGRFECFLDRGGDGAPVMIVDLQAESLGPVGESLADSAHADDSEPFAADPASKHPGWRPAGPFARGNYACSFDEPP